MASSVAVSAVPVTAMAEAVSGGAGGKVTTVSALAEALGAGAATTDGTTVKLNSDVSGLLAPLDIEIPSAGTNQAGVTIDLQGHTLDVGSSPLTVSSNGNVQILSTVEGGEDAENTGTITGSGASVIQLGNIDEPVDDTPADRSGGTLTLAQGNIVQSNDGTADEDEEPAPDYTGNVQAAEYIKDKTAAYEKIKSLLGDEDPTQDAVSDNTVVLTVSDDALPNENYYFLRLNTPEDGELETKPVQVTKEGTTVVWFSFSKGDNWKDSIVHDAKDGAYSFTLYKSASEDGSSPEELGTGKFNIGDVSEPEVVAPTEYVAVALDNTSSFVMQGGSVTSNTEAIDVSGASAVTITDGKVSAGTTGIDVDDGTSVRLEGGDISGLTAVELGQANGTPATMLMTGGTLTSTGAAPTLLIQGGANAQLQNGAIENENLSGRAVQVGTAQTPGKLSLDGPNAQMRITSSGESRAAIMEMNKDSIVTINSGVVESTNETTGGFAIQNGRTTANEPGGTLEIGGDAEISSVSAEEGSSAILAFNNANVTIADDATITSNAELLSAVQIGYAGQASDKSELTVDGGVITNNAVDGYGVGVFGQAVATLSDGQVAAPNGVGVGSNGSSNSAGSAITVSGANIDANIGVYAPAQSGTLSIYEGSVIKALETGVEVRGGTFNLRGGDIILDPSNTSAPEFTPNAGGTSVANAAIALSTHVTNDSIMFLGNGGNVSAQGEAAAIYQTSQQLDEALPTDMKISNGNYTGQIVTEQESPFIEGGIYTGVADNFYKDQVATSAAAILVSGGKTPAPTYYVGAEQATEGLASATSGSTAEVLNATGTKDLVTGPNVTVKNSTTDSITVNGETIAAGASSTSAPQTLVWENLSNAIQRAEGLTESAYTADSWQALQVALGQAKTLLNTEDKTDVTQTQIDNATSALTTAIENLVENTTPPVNVDKTALNALIQQVENDYVESDYTAQSWEALQNTLTYAKNVMNSETATQAVVDAAVTSLQDAISQLIGATESPSDIPTMEDLQALIAEAEGLTESDYTEASWLTLQDALDAAQAVADNADATDAEIETAYSALQAAIDGLIDASGTDDPGDEAPTLESLEALIAEAKALKQSDYTNDTWATLQTALATAEAVVADQPASADKIEGAYNTLKEAIAGLQKVNASTGDNNGSNNAGGNTTQVDTNGTNNGASMTTTSGGSGTTSTVEPKVQSKMPQTGVAVFGSLFTTIGAAAASIFTKKRIGC